MAFKCAARARAPHPVSFSCCTRGLSLSYPPGSFAAAYDEKTFGRKMSAYAARMQARGMVTRGWWGVPGAQAIDNVRAMRARRFVWAVVLLAAACGGGTAEGPGAARPEAPRAPRITAKQLVDVHRTQAPSPSPDGASVAFVSDAPGLPQLFLAQVGAAPVAEKDWKP